ncbi:MAG: FG-GAP-like repeat-containing protein [Bryobacteraceae bacterium]
MRSVKYPSSRIIWICCLGFHSLLAQPAFFRRDISVGDGPGPLIVGDFNGDGRADVAFRSWACRLPSSLSGPYQRCPQGTVGGVISVLLNAGSGNFLPPIDTVIDLEVPFDTYPPLAADLNGDGKLDLLGYSLGSAPGVRSFFFLPGRGNGAFLQPREIQTGYPVATGDFNGDRIPDLLLGRDPVFPPPPGPGQPPPQLPPTPPLEILLGNGRGFFQTAGRTDFSPWTQIADFNRDGRSDVAAVLSQSETQTTIVIHLAQADGTLRTPVETVLDALPLAADFNRDGLPDLVTPAGIWLGKGDGSFQPSRSYASAAAARQWAGPAIAADFTGDGLMDLAVAHRGEENGPANSFSLLAGRGDGSFAPPVEYAERLAGGPAGDLDGDGRADLARTGDNTVSVLLFRPEGGPALRRAVSSASDTAIVAPGSLAAIYLSTSATATERAEAAPWPARLGGISLEVRDKAGVARLAPLLYVSPSQVNFQVPPDTALGEATLVLIADRGPAPVGGMQVDSVAPALFLVNRPDPFTEESGVAVPAALAVRVAADGRQTPVPVFTCPSFPGSRCGPVPIPLPQAGDPTYVSFFGTGFRGANPVNVICTINGVRVPVEHAGPQGTPGLDQINVRLAPEVRGQPPFSFGIVTISIDGVPANGTWLRFR